MPHPPSLRQGGRYPIGLLTCINTPMLASSILPIIGLLAQLCNCLPISFAWLAYKVPFVVFAKRAQTCVFLEVAGKDVMQRVGSSPTRLMSCCRACIFFARTTSMSTLTSKKRGRFAEANFVIFLTISNRMGLVV